MKLYETDYVLFKDNKPVECLDTIYASESVIELFNDGFKLEQGEKFIKTTDLPIEWQKKYIAQIDVNHCLAWLGLKGIDVFTVNNAVFVSIENQDIMIHPYEVHIKAKMYRNSVNYHGTN